MKIKCGKGAHAETQRVMKLRKSGTKKYRVLGIDKFDGSDWVHGEYNTADEALQVARSLTKSEMKMASDSSVATVFYVYDPHGKYIGGDTWNKE